MANKLANPLSGSFKSPPAEEGKETAKAEIEAKAAGPGIPVPGGEKKSPEPPKDEKDTKAGCSSISFESRAFSYASTSKLRASLCSIFLNSLLFYHSPPFIAISENCYNIIGCRAQRGPLGCWTIHNFL